MKDPAFLFYSESFMLGTMIMPFDERGRYITLLCYQHQNGHLSEETIRLLVGSFSDILKSKFEVDEKGLYFNRRLDIEIEKRKQFVDTRRDNGRKGGRPKVETKPKRKPTAKPLGYPTGKPTENLIINRDIIINIIKDNNINEEYLKIWNEWIVFKKEQFKFEYKTDDSEKKAFNELLSLSGNDYQKARKIVDNSIIKGWKGLFELKEWDSKPPDKPAPEKKEPIDYFEKGRYETTSNPFGAKIN